MYICHLVILGCIWIRLVSERMFFLVCSSQRSGIDAVHVSSMKSSMKFEFLAFEVVYILVPTMAMDDWLRVSEVVWLAGAQESLLFDV